MNNVGKDCRARHQIVPLRNKPYPGAQPSELAGPQHADLATENGNCAGCRSNEAQQALQKRGFAGAVGPDQCHGLPTPDCKADIREHRRVLPVAGQKLLDSKINVRRLDRQVGDETSCGECHSPTNSENCG